MSRKQPEYDDLNEMRKDVDRLGEAFGIRTSLKGKRRAPVPKRAVGAATPPPAEKSGEPGKVLKGRMRKALGLAAMVLALGAQGGQASEGRPAPIDSLRTLRVIITSEFSAGDTVLQVQDPRRADSLMRNVPTRGPLLQAIRDTAVGRELRSRAEFNAYWDRLEAASGHRALRGNLAAQDVDKTRIPKTYLFDSSVVVFPGWIVIRKRGR